MSFDLGAKCANEALVPPLARQACRLDHKPKTVTKATPHDQVCAPRRHFVICYSSFHTFCPKTDRLFSVLHNGCHVVGRSSVSFKRVLVQRLRTIRNQLRIFIGLLKGHFDVEGSTLCRVLVEETGGPVLERDD